MLQLLQDASNEAIGEKTKDVPEDKSVDRESLVYADKMVLIFLYIIFCLFALT